MNNKQSKRRRDIKTKLMAAICMLLVSSIMMVSTTYAWFTLSTAPEVTGINTAVGANGNLEMALQRPDGNSALIESNVGDSMASKSALESNITWGNLVNLSDTSYGLGLITLYPSTLSTIQDGEDTEVNPSPLRTPKYGADGRVADLTNTAIGTYANGTFSESTLFGVRGIGTSSGMTARNVAYRQALINASVAAGAGKTTASTTLNNNGSTLSNIAVTYVANANATFPASQVNAIKNVIDDLLGVEGKTGALQSIEIALKEYIIAYNLTNVAFEDTFEDVKTTVQGATLENLVAGTVKVGETTLTVPDGFEGADGYVAKLQTAIDSATEARGALPSDLSSATETTTYTWDQIDDALKPLLNTEHLKVNGLTVDHIRSDPNGTGDLMDAYLAQGGLFLIMPSGSGVFSDIADFCGDYDAQIEMYDVQIPGQTSTISKVPAKMNTEGANPYYFSTIDSNVRAKEYGTTGGSSDNPMDTFYGYILDLAFRTNAANSYLMLQPEATDRIYGEDGANSNTQGGGATMTLTTASTTFSGDSMKALMGHIRLAFFDTDTSKIYGYGKLNLTEGHYTVDGATVTAELIMCDSDGAPKTDDTATTGRNESLEIMELTQNTIHELSVMVWLEGADLENSDVAADVAQSMAGSLNLQFASSANLTPMNYSDLMSGDGGALGDNTETTGPATPELIELTATTDISGASVISAAYSSGKVVVGLNGVDEGTSVKVTVGTEELTTTTITQESVVVAIVSPTSEVTSATTVTVSAAS